MGCIQKNAEKELDSSIWNHVGGLLMEIKQLIDDYIHWLKKEITFEKIGEYYEITTPFLNSANDFIQIYVRIDKDTIFFTDDNSEKFYFI